MVLVEADGRVGPQPCTSTASYGKSNLQKLRHVMILDVKVR